MSFPFHRACVAALVSSALLPAAAAELPLIVVTATRTATLSDELLSDVSVVDRQQIEQAGASTLSELLTTLPGIQHAGNGGRGASGSLSLRGTNTNQTLVLIDGLRLSSATTGATALEHVPLEQVERIEVLRGAASSLYGSDAIGGVIQIFTRQGEGRPRPNFSLGAGSEGTTIGSAGYGGRIGGTRFSIQAGWERSDSFSSIRAAKGGLYDMYNPDDDDYRNRNVSAKVSQQFGEALQIGAEVLHFSTRKRFDSTNCDDFGMVCTADFDNRQQQRLTAYGAHAALKVTSFWTSSLRIGETRDEALNWRHDPTAAAPEVRQRYQTTQQQLSWQNEFELARQHRLLAFVDWREVEVRSTQTFVFTEQQTRSLGLGYQGAIGAHSLQASLRSDHIERLGRHETGSLSYGYQLAAGWTARAGIGSAFHAPTFNDLYWPLDQVNFFQGNPNLKPERARTREIGLHYEAGRNSGALTAYHNRIEDLLDYVPGVAPTWIGTYGNVNSATLKGLSLAAAHRGQQWELRLAADVLSAKDDDTGKTLQRRAPRTATVEVRRHFGDFSIGAQVQGSSRRYNDRANTQTLSGYGLLNLDASYAIDRDWKLFARVGNVFDKEYTLVQSTMAPYNEYATAGRNAFVGIRYSPQ
ncbi:MAG: TonB-dependent receptor [Dechloromonas sp.]|nr:MAG: TonB-dependent receptor [Dechloromonas sp.]